MLRPLLAERFHLDLHRETRQLPIYALVSAKSGVRLGESREGSCTRVEDYSGPQPPPEPPASPICGFKQRLRPQTQGAPLMALQGTGVTLGLLARVLGTTLDREVLDETGIGGTFDFAVEYAPDDDILARVVPEAQPGNTTGASLFTAMQEQ